MKRAHYIAFAVVIVLTVIVLKLPARTATQFKLAIGSLFLPLFGLTSSAQELSGKAGNAVVPRKELLRQNEELRLETAGLRVQLQRQAELERENDRLRDLLAFQKRSPWNIRAARVIARDPANWWRNVQIDLGRRDGVQPDVAVLTADGLVGKVTEVAETRSRVVLLGDPNCRVAAEVHAPPAKGGKVQLVDNGVITGGASVLDETMAELEYLSLLSSVRPGQLVYTSGIGGVFPKGIVIGQVVDTRPVDFGLHAVARVKLAVKIHLLEEVWVMMP